eukprot:765999-Hanusia_phi.AAC.1
MSSQYRSWLEVCREAAGDGGCSGSGVDRPSWKLAGEIRGSRRGIETWWVHKGKHTGGDIDVEGIASGVGVGRWAVQGDRRAWNPGMAGQWQRRKKMRESGVACYGMMQQELRHHHPTRGLNFTVSIFSESNAAITRVKPEASNQIAKPESAVKGKLSAIKDFVSAENVPPSMQKPVKAKSSTDVAQDDLKPKPAPRKRTAQSVLREFQRDVKKRGGPDVIEEGWTVRSQEVTAED